MSAQHDPKILAEWVGSEREPIVTIDEFAKDADALRQAATSANFAPIGEYYPGVRAPMPSFYLEMVDDTLRSILSEFFGYRAGGEILRSYYSIATTPPEQLSLPQRIPHTDAYDDHQIAMLHFLGHKDFGGTAFFRHRSTGFETVNAQRVEKFHESLSADFEQLGTPEPAYIGADSPLFERTHVCEHRFNRAIIYRGKMLHCAALANADELPDSVEYGRLTAATFVRPRNNSGVGRPS